MKRLATLLVALATTLAACTEVRPGRTPSALEQRAAAEQARQLARLTALGHTPERGDVLLSAVDFAPAIALLGPEGLPLTLPSRSGAPLDGCVVASDTAATFSECEVDEHVVDGNVSHRGGEIGAELVDVFILGPDAHGATTIDAWLSRETGALIGSVEVDVVWTAGDSEHVLDATVRADGVAFDGDGCPIEGSLTIEGSVDDRSGGYTIWYGPSCGDVLIQP